MLPKGSRKRRLFLRLHTWQKKRLKERWWALLRRMLVNKATGT